MAGIDRRAPGVNVRETPSIFCGRVASCLLRTEGERSEGEVKVHSFCQIEIRDRRLVRFLRKARAGMNVSLPDKYSVRRY